MSRFLLICRTSPYAEAPEELDQLGDALVDSGHEVSRLDLRESPMDVNRCLAQLLQTPHTAAICWDAAGLNLATADGKSLWDTLKIPALAWLTRHPSYFMKDLTAPVQQMRLLVVDASHKEFVDRYYERVPSEVIPLGACWGSGAIWEGGELEIVVAGTYYSPELVKEAWQKLPRTIHPFITETIEAALKSPQTPLHQVAEQFATARTKKLAPEQIAVLPLIDTYIRGHQRILWLDTLTEANISVDIFGSEWDLYPNIRHHRWHGGVAFTRFLSLLHHTKLLLVPGPGLDNGPHRSVLAALCADTPVLTQPNPYYSHNFPSLPTTDPADLVSRVNTLLNTAPTPSDVNYHTWCARTNQLCQYLNLAAKV